MKDIKTNKFGVNINKQNSVIGKVVSPTSIGHLETNTEKLKNLKKANSRAEQMMMIIASSAEKGTYDTCEKANKLIDECYKYAYSLYVEE